eukprot:TRINITY_DN4234_c0_g1_i1.p1 TRINITY_DN4234_c0_g1~~TRINITY_DN4234_c0_g1_i1.p1  ORF type:complete len:456 (+),score=96.19 TRINITY_DN4234_c0_g1_i1:592-1959(+)
MGSRTNNSFFAMKNYAFISFLLFGVLASTITVASAFPFQGSFYSSTCEMASSYYPFGGYLKRFVNFNEAGWEMRLEYFADSSCTTLDWIHRVLGAAISLPPTNDGSQITHPIDLEIAEQFITPITTFSVTTLTDLCSGIQLSKGQTVDLQFANCTQLNIFPEAACPMWYQRAAVVDGLFYMGIRSAAVCSLANRPTALDMTRPLRAMGPLPAVTGVWATDCLGEDVDTSYKIVLALQGNEFSYKVQGYSLPGCPNTAQTMTELYAGDFAITHPVGSTGVLGATYQVQYILRSSHFIVYSASLATLMQSDLYNGVTCPAMTIAPGTLVDSSQLTCANSSLSIRSCPVMFDVMELSTNYITSRLQIGLLGVPSDLKSSCQVSSRPSGVGGPMLYNTTPQWTGSLVTAPVAVAVVVSLLIGALVSAIVAVLCYRRFVVMRGAKLLQASPISTATDASL